MRLSEKELEDLLEPFKPDEVMPLNKGALKLTTIKASAVIERVHKVFPNGFTVSGEATVDFIPDSILNWKDINYAHKHNRKNPDRKMEVPAQIRGSKPYVRYNGTITIITQGSDVIGFDITGVKELDGAQDWEDAAKSCRTNAINKGLYENLLLGRDVFRGYYSFQGGRLVIKDPAAEEEKQRKAEAKINRIQFLREMIAWGSDNEERFRGVIAAFRDQSDTNFESIKELGFKDMSQLYRMYKKAAEAATKEEPGNG